MSYSLPPIESIPLISEQDRVEVLDHLFEPCSTFSQYVTSNNLLSEEYGSYGHLIENIRKHLLGFLSSENEKSAHSGPIDPRIAKIIAAHPRLGPSKDAGKLSAHSLNEQKSLLGTKEEAEQLRRLNDEYETAFPGLRYVVFVNGRLRPVIMQNMESRIHRADIRKEREEAFNAMCDIALDRARKLGAKL